MTAVVLGIVSPIAAAIIFSIYIRIARWKPNLAALPLIGTGILALLGYSAIQAGYRIPLDYLFIAFVLTLSLCVSYVLFLFGIIYDSPTLALVNAIADCGEEGMKEADLDLFVACHPFVESRLSALINSGLLVEENGLLKYRGKIDFLLHFSDFYRRICRYKTESG